MSEKNESKITDAVAMSLAIQMREKFLLPFKVEELLVDFNALSQLLPEEFRPQAATFQESILAAHETAAFPYKLAQAKANALHWQRISLAERIRSIPVYEEDYAVSEEERDRRAEALAQEKFTNFVKSEEGLNCLVRDLSQTLVEALREPSTAKGADELLLQAVVSLWSAFEVLVRDELVILLNAYPAIAFKILNSPTSKRYFELPKLSIEELSESNFNFTSKMGSIIFGSRDFSDLKVVKAAFGALSNNCVLIEALNNNKLWHLNQDRHLIVHRRGVVDLKYKTSTHSVLKVGERISITPELLRDYFNVVVHSAEAFINGISECISFEEEAN